MPLLVCAPRSFLALNFIGPPLRFKLVTKKDKKKQFTHLALYRCKQFNSGLIEKNFKISTMIKFKLKKKVYRLAGVLLATQMCALDASWAFEGGLLTLLERVEASQPQIKSARYSYNAALEDVEAAKRRRGPVLSAAVESDTGTQTSAPAQSLQVELKIWDKGQTNAQIAEAQAIAKASQVAVELERRRVFLDVISAWQGYVLAEARHAIALDSSKRLSAYKDMMRRRVDAEVSPLIELEVVESRLLQSTVDQVLALSARKTAASKLVQLSGIGETDIQELIADSVPHLLNHVEFQACLTTECWRSALDKEPSVVKAQWEVTALEQRLKAKESERWPYAYLRLTQPLDVGTGAANERGMKSSSFLGFRYAPGAGFESAVQVRAMASRLASAQQGVESAKREASAILEADSAEFLSSRSRFVSHEQAVKSSLLVLDSYTAQFVAARKSWLDLLNAVRDLSQANQAKVEAEISMASAYYRFELRSGRFGTFP